MFIAANSLKGLISLGSRKIIESVGLLLPLLKFIHSSPLKLHSLSPFLRRDDKVPRFQISLNFLSERANRDRSRETETEKERDARAPGRRAKEEVRARRVRA